MTIRSRITGLLAREDLNFLLTNRIPRRLATRLAGLISHSEQPLVRGLSLAAWRFFCDVDLNDAQETRFSGLHAGFTRALRDGARPIDPDPAVLVSPCDGIVGACGAIAGDTLLQVKGRPYSLTDLLLGDGALAASHDGGSYVTLRLTAGMYHRFHAPHDCVLERVSYQPGALWNVNPATLRRVDRLFCRNERAVLRTRLAASGCAVTLVPVAAILVAGIRLHALNRVLDSRQRTPLQFSCAARYRKGEEMGWFEHGSTIVVLAPPGLTLCAAVREGQTIRLGEPLMRLR